MDLNGRPEAKVEEVSRGTGVFSVVPFNLPRGVGVHHPLLRGSGYLGTGYMWVYSPS